MDNDYFAEEGGITTLLQPQYRTGFMPNSGCAVLVKEFAASFFAAFDAMTEKTEDIIRRDVVLHYYAPNAIMSKCLVSKDSRGIMKNHGREVFFGKPHIESAVSHFDTAAHDIRNAVFDVSFLQNGSTPWICLNCNGKMLRNGKHVPAPPTKPTAVFSGGSTSDTFIRCFVLTNPGSTSHLQIWRDMIVYVETGPTHVSMLSNFPTRFVLDSEDFTSDKPPSTFSQSQISTTPEEIRRSSSTGDVDVEGPCQGKHPCSFISELCQKMNWPLDFELEGSGGPSHDPWFQYVVRIGQRTFPAGQGRNKKDAKKAAARMALEILGPEVELVDLAGADSEEQCDSVVELELDEETIAEEQDDSKWEEVLSEETRDLIKQTDKSPISIINEYAQKRQLSKPGFLDVDDQTQPGFSVRLKMSEVLYPLACGKNKKQARTRAASLALNELVISKKIHQPAHQILPHRTLRIPHMPKGTLFGDIAAEIHKLFRSFCKDNPIYSDSAKILAGIVMRDERRHEAFIISVATGNRCIRGDKLSTDGQVLNDCHAEILVRRGFVRFLYSQLLDFMDKKNNTIFEEAPSVRTKLCIRQRFTFHLYINTAPCGDGRVFTLSEPDEATKANPDDLAVHRPLYTDPKKHGVLRTKIEKGEGTIPVLDYADIQTLDGISGGERLRTMSCSDKLMKWNVLGLQGALLSRFMEPVYLSTLTIGTLSHHGHLSRAVCCRAGGVYGLPSGYFVNHPILGLGEFGSDSRSTAKSTPMSISWTYCDQSIEQIDGTHGILMSKSGSRLCKREMFHQFRDACSRIGLRHTRDLYYYEAKAESRDYQTAKRVFYEFCAQKGYGGWLGKPKEEKLFR